MWFWRLQKMLFWDRGTRPQLRLWILETVEISLFLKSCSSSSPHSALFIYIYITWEYFHFPGKCNPDDLVVEEDEKQHPFQSPPYVQEPEPPLLEEYTPDPRSGILWENYPPRGDVPYRTHFSHFSVGEPQDHFHSQGQRQLRILGRSRHRVSHGHLSYNIYFI